MSPWRDPHSIGSRSIRRFAKDNRPFAGCGSPSAWFYGCWPVEPALRRSWRRIPSSKKKMSGRQCGTQHGRFPMNDDQRPDSAPPDSRGHEHFAPHGERPATSGVGRPPRLYAALGGRVRRVDSSVRRRNRPGCVHSGPGLFCPAGRFRPGTAESDYITTLEPRPHRSSRSVFWTYSLR